ncbi:MAG: MFS transporter [Opitutales bacterium]|nr:MFS transporter [Opitutales bacterium]
MFEATKNVFLSEKKISFSGVAALWVATLYFAQGLPNAVVDLVAPVAMKDLGFSNSVITFVAAWAYLPWVLKALWSPAVDSIGRKRSWILKMQIAGALLAAALAGTLFFNVPAVVLVAVLFSIAVFSATHDIAADGFYMLALDSGRQAFFSGWRSTFFRLSQVFAKGGIIAAAGVLISTGASTGTAWTQVFLGVAVLTGIFALIHALILPRPANDVPAGTEKTSLVSDFSDTWKTFFKKERIGFLLFLLLFFRFGEVQISVISPLFFKDAIEHGGLALDNKMFGLLNGTFGVVAMLAGGVIAGWLVSRNGLRTWLWPMIWLLNLPDFIYVALAHWQPGSPAIIGAGIVVEQFGYGFGFTGYMLYMLYACAGTRRAVAHYAICTAFMALGVMIPKLWSGALQQIIGYENFFWWAIICTLPGFWIVAQIRKFLPADFGKKD